MRIMKSRFSILSRFQKVNSRDVNNPEKIGSIMCMCSTVTLKVTQFLLKFTKIVRELIRDVGITSPL